MYEILKDICTSNNWGFQYSRKDFTNLYDESAVVNKPLVFLDPVLISNQYGDYGEIVSKTYSGGFMILVSSDIDEIDYDTRYQTHIKPLIDGAISILEATLKCRNDVTVNSWSMIEIINALDFNGDGLIVNYLVTQK